MSEFKEVSTDGVEIQQAIGLTDEFLHKLVQELDHEEIVGRTLGGSYARGTATLFSDLDNVQADDAKGEQL